MVLRHECASDDLLDWAAKQVAHYKKIRRLQVVGQIPKSPSGKILRRILEATERAAQNQALTGARP